MAKPTNDEAPLRRWLGFGVSAACLIGLAWRVDWPATRRALGLASLPLLAVAASLLATSYLVQAQRWRIILVLPKRLPFSRSLALLMIGYVGNVVFPLRAGDLLRAALVHRVRKGATPQALASLVIERLLDVLTNLVFGGIVVLVVALPPSVKGGLAAFAATAAAAVVALALLMLRGEVALSALKPHLDRWAPRFADRIHASLRGLVDGLRPMGSPRRLGLAFAVSLVQWSLVAATMVACVEAFGLGLPWSAGVLLMVVTNLGSAIPSAPASVGVFHGVAVLALAVWNVSPSVALAVAVVSHGLTVGLQLAGGVVAIAFEGGLTAVRSAAQETESVVDD